MTLRRGFSAAMFALLVAMVAVPGALIAITSMMNFRAAELGDAVESVRITQKSQLDLLLYARAKDPFVREQLEGELLSDLDQVQAFISSPQEEEGYRKAREAVTSYLQVDGTEGKDVGLLHSAFRSLQNLTRIN